MRKNDTQVITTEQIFCNGLSISEQSYSWRRSETVCRQRLAAWCGESDQYLGIDGFALWAQRTAFYHM
jgi:hypothetical protein